MAAVNNKLAGLKKKASVKPAVAPAKDDRPVIVFDAEANPEFMDVVSLSTLVDQLGSTLEGHKNYVKQLLRKKFVETWWNQRALPQNPRIVVKTKDGSEDMSFMFMVKYREQGLNGVVPNADKLPEGVTAEDFLLKALKTSVGLSQANALRLLNEGESDPEIKVSQELTLVGTIDSMQASNDPDVRSAVEKLIGFLTADEATGEDGDEDELDVLTDDERNKILQTVQTVRVKKGFMERAHMYVESAEQLDKLLEFVKATLQVSSFEYAKSATPAHRAEMLASDARLYLEAKAAE